MHIGIGALAGLGQSCISYDDEGNCTAYDSPTVTPVDSGSVVTSENNLCAGMSTAQCSAALNAVTAGSSPVSSASVIPASSTSLWATLTNSLAQIAAPIVKQATTQAPYFITNPATGQSVLYNPSTGAVGNAAGTSSLSTALSSSGDLFPLLLLGGLLLVMMEGGKH